MGVATAKHLDGFVRTRADGRGKNARDAASKQASCASAPVLMTALAMIIGMVPMAVGLGEGASKMRRLAAL